MLRAGPYTVHTQAYRYNEQKLVNTEIIEHMWTNIGIIKTLRGYLCEDFSR
jgi:hypothetical protein